MNYSDDFILCVPEDESKRKEKNKSVMDEIP